MPSKRKIKTKEQSPAQRKQRCIILLLALASLCITPIIFYWFLAHQDTSHIPKAPQEVTASADQCCERDISSYVSSVSIPTSTMFIMLIIVIVLAKENQHRRLLTNGIETSAKITNIGKVKSLFSRSYIQLGLSYLFDGKPYESSVSAPKIFTSPFLKTGDTVTLFVDPKNPSRFVVYETSPYEIEEV